MTDPRLTRRAFVATLAAAPLVGEETPWIDLFDGRSLQGWRAAEAKQSWTVRDGGSDRLLTCGISEVEKL